MIKCENKPRENYHHGYVVLFISVFQLFEDKLEGRRTSNSPIFVFGREQS